MQYRADTIEQRCPGGLPGHRLPIARDTSRQWDHV
jgi:hypothetical protein